MTRRSETTLAGGSAARHNPRVRLLPLLFLLCACPEAVVVEPPLPTVDPTAPAPAGEARAAVVAEGQEAAFFGGIGAEGQAGDVKIFNEHVQFVLSDVGRRHGWIDVGGTLVDADLVRPEGVAGRDALDDGFLAFGVSRLFEAESIEVISDGLDGGDAVVRTLGRDVQWDFFTHGIESPPLMADLGLSIERTYTLSPGSWALRVDTTFTNPGDEAITARPAEGFMASKEDFRPWFAGLGLVGEAGGEVAAAGYWGTHNEGVFSLWGAEPLAVSSATSLLSIASLRLFNHRAVELSPGASETRSAWCGLGPDTASIESERLRAAGEELTVLSGGVSDSDGPVAGARVHLLRDGAVHGFAVTDADGRYSAVVPPGSWQAWVTARLPFEQVESRRGVGRLGHLSTPALQQEHLAALAGAPTIPMAGGRWSVGPEDVEVGAAAVERDFTLGQAGRIDLQVTRESVGSAAVIDAIDQRGGVDSPVPEELREALGLDSGGAHPARAWTADGEVALLLPPSDYAIEVSRSWRDGRADREVAVVPGVPVSVEVELDVEVPRDGYVSVDTHLHAAPSMDGRTAMEDRLIACAAAGLDVPVTTDHDRFADYRPLATALGLDPMMTVMPGTEVTSVVRGHWNLYPVEPVGQAARNGGALVWWDRELTETDALVERIRGVGTQDSLLQVNHGRLALGMMDASGYAPASGQPGTPRLWSWDFDTVEIVTAHDVEDWHANRDDWFSFLQQGQIKVPTGSSDSHDLDRACALGRTDVYVGEGEWDLSDVRDALAAGDVVVSSGVTIRADIGGARPGSTVSGGAQSLDVRVLGPSWLRPGAVRIWANSAVVFEQDLAESDTGVFFDAVVPLDLPEDAWVVVEVDGGAAQGGWWGGHAPYGVTNAFFVDVAGDGWTPPGQ